MIKFTTVKWKNFFSYGDVFTKVNLTKTKTTIVTGSNGAGKSTFLDALTYGLFGRPFRKIKIEQLVNSINEADSVVEVEFFIGSKEYRVVRGLKPVIFEVYCNDVLLNQDAKNSDYQKLFEQDILKMSYKTFTQLVVLGAAKFKPFMQLSGLERRQVVEDLLDLNVFSSMKDELKKKVTANKNKTAELKTEIGYKKDVINTTKNLVETLNQKTLEKVEEYDAEITTKNAEISNNKSIEKVKQDSIKVIQKKIDDEGGSEDLIEDINIMVDAINKKTSKIKANKKEIKFYHDNDKCPTCNQEIDDSFMTDKISTLKKQTKDFESENIKNKEIVDGWNITLDVLKGYQSEITDLNNEIYLINSNISRIESDIKKIKEKIKLIEDNDDSDLIVANNKYNSLLLEYDKMINQYKKCLVIAKYYNLTNVILDDKKGVKAKIIDTYIPKMNALINQYLNDMEFHVSFNLDSNFDETIKSRYRDTFSYSSFSEGEKTRINLALLFTWREISRMKNSTNTNLIVFDEIMDSSLDEEGIEDFSKLIYSLNTDTSCFVISHNDRMKNKFDRMLQVKKEGNFSMIEEIL